VDCGRDEEEVAEEEEDSSEGVGGGWMTRRGRFGWQADPRFDFPRSRGIFGTVGEPENVPATEQERTKAEQGKAGQEAEL
jgi:hypothetical protein